MRRVFIVAEPHHAARRRQSFNDDAVDGRHHGHAFKRERGQIAVSMRFGEACFGLGYGGLGDPDGCQQTPNVRLCGSDTQTETFHRSSSDGATFHQRGLALILVRQCVGRGAGGFDLGGKDI